MVTRDAIRLRLSFDPPPPGMPASSKYAIFVELGTCTTVSDIEQMIIGRFGFSRGAILKLALDGFMILPGENARVFRNDDHVTVTLQDECIKTKCRKRKSRSGSGTVSKKIAKFENLKLAETKKERSPLSTGSDKRERKTQRKDSILKGKHQIKLEINPNPSSNNAKNAPAAAATVHKCVKPISAEPNSQSDPGNTRKKNVRTPKTRKSVEKGENPSRSVGLLKPPAIDPCSSETDSSEDDPTTKNGLSEVNISHNPADKCGIKSEKKQRTAGNDITATRSVSKTGVAKPIINTTNKKASREKTTEAASAHHTTFDSSSDSSSDSDSESTSEKPAPANVAADVCTSSKPTNGLAAVPDDISEGLQAWLDSSTAITHEATDSRKNQVGSNYRDPGSSTNVSVVIQNPKLPNGAHQDPHGEEGNEEQLSKPVRNYADMKTIGWPPQVGDLIAYKLLEMTEFYTPEISDYKEASVERVFSASESPVGVNAVAVRILWPPQNKEKRSGRFEMDLDEEVESDAENLIEWASLIEPKFIKRTGT